MSLIKVDVIDSWLGTVLNWAEEEAIQVIGGIVSIQLQSKSYLFQSLLIYLDSPSLFTRRVLVSRLKL